MNKIMKIIVLTLIGVGCFSGGLYYATNEFDESLNRVMEEYEVISNKVDTFSKVSNPKTIRLYVNELNKILDDIDFLHRLIETGQLADVALTDMLDGQGSIVSRVDSLHSELLLSIANITDYNSAQDVVDEHTKVLIGSVNEKLDKHKTYIEDFNNRMTQLQMKIDAVNKEIGVVKNSKFGKKIWGK
jgi:archaellum component FlaC